jgi:hypothetical protein
MTWSFIGQDEWTGSRAMYAATKTIFAKKRTQSVASAPSLIVYYGNKKKTIFQVDLGIKESKTSLFSNNVRN